MIVREAQQGYRASIPWSPIESLDMGSIDMDFREIDGLHRQWLEVRASVEESTPKAYDQFNEELFRSWAIETGIIEGLYDLDRGVTLTLIQQGFSGDIIDELSSNVPPNDLVATLRAHRDSIDYVNGWIEESRPLTKFFIRSLHQAITSTQTTYQAINTLGQWFDAELHRGQFKRLPNNPTRPDGVVHQYCPPEQVESELDNLTRWYDASVGRGDHPLAIGAWLHHRFTQIHPFEDGNGRMVRALLTWHLVKSKYLPVVVTRDLRGEYISTLERADRGDLTSHIRFLTRLELDSLHKALSVEVGQPPSGADTLGEVVGFIVDKFNKRRRDDERRLRSVQTVAVDLRQQAEVFLREQSERVCEQLEAGMQKELIALTLLGGPEEGNEYYYNNEILQTAKDAGHWFNRQEARYFIRVTLRVTGSSAPVMVFVVSLHGVGRGLTGIMAATSFLKYSNPADQGDDDDYRTDGTEFMVCNPEPFLFTVSDTASDLRPAFERWLTQGFSTALRRWGESVIDLV